MDQGIVVITHEASDVENALYDVEAFDNAAYGRHLMDNLAKCMGEEGKYVIFVGSLTTTRTTSGWMRPSPIRRRSTRRWRSSATRMSPATARRAPTSA